MSTDDKARNNSVRRVVRSLAKSISEECNQPVKYTEALRIWNTLGVEVTKNKNDTSPVEDSESVEDHVVNGSEVTEPKTIDLRKLTDKEFAEAVTELGASVIPISNNSDEPDVYDPLDTAKVQAVDGKVEKDDVDYLGQVVAVTSSKGGVGKSTIAITLASYLAYASKAAFDEGKSSRPLKVVLVDLDMRNGQLGFMTNNIVPTILGIRSAGVSVASIRESVINDIISGFDMILAPKLSTTCEDFPVSFIDETIRTLKTMYDYVILNTSIDYLSMLLQDVVYPIANHIVYVSDVSATSALSMSRWIRKTTLAKGKGGAEIDPKKVGIVINKALVNVGMPAERIAKATRGLPIIALIPSEPELFISAINNTRTDFPLIDPVIKNGIMSLANSIVSTKHSLSENFFVPKLSARIEKEKLSESKDLNSLKMSLGLDGLPPTFGVQNPVLESKKPISSSTSSNHSLPKAICIGPKMISDTLATLNPEWVFEKHAEKVMDFWVGLNNGAISADLDAVFILDAYFDKSGTNKEFEQIITYLSPYCFVGVLNDLPNDQETIKNRIENEMYKLGVKTDTKYYFIDRNKPKESINTHYATYLANKDS